MIIIAFLVNYYSSTAAALLLGWWWLIIDDSLGLATILFLDPVVYVYIRVIDFIIAKIKPYETYDEHNDEHIPINEKCEFEMNEVNEINEVNVKKRKISEM